MNIEEEWKRHGVLFRGLIAQSVRAFDCYLYYSLSKGPLFEPRLVRNIFLKINFKNIYKIKKIFLIFATFMLANMMNIDIAIGNLSLCICLF